MADQGEAKTKTIGFLPIEKVQTLPGWDEHSNKSSKLAHLRTETQKAKNSVKAQGWATLLLPYIEQENLGRMMGYFSARTLPATAGDPPTMDSPAHDTALAV